MTGQHSAPNFQAFDWLRDFFEPRCPRLPPPLLDLHDSTRVAQCARARDTRANRGPACSAAITMTAATAMAASAATVASANGVARGESAHPSRPAGRHGWRARPWLGRRARAPSRFAAVVRASRDGDAPAGGSGDTRRLKIFSVNDGTRPPDDARRDPPDASPANQLPRASPGPNGSRQDRPARPRLDGVPGHDHVPIRHAGSRRCATATPIVSKPDALAPNATHPGATFAFERSDSNCQMIVAAATRPFSPDPSTCSRPSIHSTASPR